MADNYATSIKLLDSHLESVDTLDTKINTDFHVLINSLENQTQLYTELSAMYDYQLDNHIENSRKLCAFAHDIMIQQSTTLHTYRENVATLRDTIIKHTPTQYSTCQTVFISIIFILIIAAILTTSIMLPGHV
jgi:hypothetical protein